VAIHVDQLKAIPLFSGLAHADLQFLAGQMDEVSIPAGTVLITERAGNNVFFVILEGVVDVSVGGKYRRTLGPHDFFGEISMMAIAASLFTALMFVDVWLFGRMMSKAAAGDGLVYFGRHGQAVLILMVFILLGAWAALLRLASPWLGSIPVIARVAAIIWIVRAGKR
jgi:hypothetical protein